MFGRFSPNQETVIYALIGVASTLILVYTVHAFIGTFVFGIFFYYATRPIYERIINHFRRPRIVASVTIVAFVLPFLILIGYTGLVALHELEVIIDSYDLSKLDSFFRPYIDGNPGPQLSTTENATNTSQSASETLTSIHPIELLQNTAELDLLVKQLFKYVSIFANFVINAIMIVTFTFYALKDGSKFRRELDATLPDTEPLRNFIEAVDADFQNLFFGNILHAVLTAIIGSVSYTVLAFVAPSSVGMPYPVLVGVLAGAASLIPVVGMKIVYFPLVAVITANSYAAGPETYWFPAVFTLVSVVVVDTIPDFVIRPYVSGDRLHMGMLMLAYIIGPILFGWYGLFFGPMMLVVVTNFYSKILCKVMPMHDRCDLDEGSKVPADADIDDEEVVVCAYDPPRVALVEDGDPTSDKDCQLDVRYVREVGGSGDADFVDETEAVDGSEVAEMK